MEAFPGGLAQPSRLPRFWSGLSISDQNGYLALRAELATPKFSNQRGRSKTQFAVMLDLIKAYSVRGESDDLSRCLVCGIVWLAQGIAVNIQQLKLLSSKCKSSINGSFGNLGYLPVPSGADTASELIQKFPFMKDQFSELRQWTIRQLKEEPPQPEIPPEPVKFDLFSGFSLDEEYTKLFTDSCPSGSLSYCTPPTDFDDGLDMGMTLEMKSPKSAQDEQFGSGNFSFQDNLLF